MPVAPPPRRSRVHDHWLRQFVEDPAQALAPEIRSMARELLLVRGLIAAAGLEMTSTLPPVVEDPTPWCSGCRARRRADCHCGPLAANE